MLVLKANTIQRTLALSAMWNVEDSCHYQVVPAMFVTPESCRAGLQATEG